MPEEVQLERLMRRDQLASEAAQARIRAQMSLSEKLKHADRVIENNGHPSDVERAVVALLRSEQLL
ncbi:Dephospho-CoA kinase [compost metagenome]